MIGVTVDNIKVGDKAAIRKTITEADILMFAAVSTDANPAHIDEEYAKNTIFKKRIAHGALTSSLVSAVLGMKLPGPGTIYISQTSKFLAPVYIGDTITAIVEAKEVNTEKNRVVFRTYCENQEGKIVMDGEAVVMPPKKK
ncbi:MAG TPA: MaoC family dehydratase [Spirochaetota bacterium]|nr:MaoC family dehydratase [Spirochaetota bacterium]HOM37783.1 MaoC family dehydratase [Spirochaetota bacterium]HPQ49340.1 MaoC family dehydratase [Spirochaetota bacterium]